MDGDCEYVSRPPCLGPNLVSCKSHRLYVVLGTDHGVEAPICRCDQREEKITHMSGGGTLSLSGRELRGDESPSHSDSSVRPSTESTVSSSTGPSHLTTLSDFYC